MLNTMIKRKREDENLVLILFSELAMLFLVQYIQLDNR